MPNFQAFANHRALAARTHRTLLPLAYLALLVLLCAGVISFLLKQGDTTAMDGGARPAVVHPGVADEGTSAASYRLMEQAAGPRGLHDASEGRQKL